MLTMKDRMPTTIVIAFSLMILLSGCVDTPASSSGLAGIEHPLSGKIWNTRQQQFATPDDVTKQLTNIDYLLLGERHDNPVHHEHQAWFIRQLSQLNRKASVAFEMIDQQQARQLEKTRYHSASQLVELLSQSDPGWQYQRYYQILFSETLQAGYPVIAANMSRQELMRSVKQGKDKLPPAYQALLSAAPLEPSQSRNLEKEIAESHCNMLNQPAISRMTEAQRLRDVVMADSLLSSRSPITVLIAGIGHVRHDRGVPIYLDRESEILTVGFIETLPGKNLVSDYQQQWDNNQLPFDLVWFTPRVERKDPCIEFRQQMQKRTGSGNRQ